MLPEGLSRFILELAWADMPSDVRSRVASLLRDFVAVSLAGRVTPTARVAVEYAASQHPGEAATSLFDGRRLAPTGAAWSNGVLANALDFDDGHRLTKGHPGANVIPAALAVAEAVGATLDQFLAAVTVGYEVALRAGIDLHARSCEYHASGAWGALGAAVAAARLLGLDPVQTGHALGLAEYHAPIAPVLRSVHDPAMTKDACGWGAFLGVSSALLAQRGFTAASSSFANTDLGSGWHVRDVYVKKFPCCRWSHPAIEAALVLRSEAQLEPHRVSKVRLSTFAEAAAIARRQPETTEEAQYSLVWPVSVALAHGDFSVQHVLEPALGDPAASRLASLVEVDVDPAFSAAFPARRFAVVTVESVDGVVYRSGATEAPGEPEDPGWAEIVQRKFEAFGDELSTVALRDDSSLSRRSREELLSLLARYDQG